MTGMQDGTCRVEGAKYLADQASAEQICRKFKRRLFSALDRDVDRDALSVTLRIEKVGTITAMLRSEGQGKIRRYTELAIDVADRALNLGDIDRLAEAAADVMNKQ